MTITPDAPTVSPLDPEVVAAHCDAVWDGIEPVLHEYIAIPALSQNFDPDWRANREIARAVELIAAWCRERPIPGLAVEVGDPPPPAPGIGLEIPATDAGG
ncbi:MAG: peptidase M20, partial [Actinomycetota bacterium]